MMLGGGFNSSKLKCQLKMAVSRIQIASNKKTALLKQNMREVAVLLAQDPPKEEMAGIKAEALIRDDNMLEALEIIQLECEMLHERIKLLDFSKTCPPDLVSVVSTVMWASHRVDIPELQLVRKQFKAKYGKTFEENAFANKDNVLNDRVVAKLSIHPPAAYLVQCYLERICEQFEVDWKPRVKLTSSELVEPMVAPSGYSVGAGQGTGLGAKIVEPPPPNQTAIPMSDDYSNLKNGGPSPGAPPVAVAQPYVPAAPIYIPGEQYVPTAPTYIPGASDPYVPTAPTYAPGTSKADYYSGPSKPDYYEEVDVFVPPGTGTTMPTAPTFETTKTNAPDARDDHNNNDDNTAPGGGASTSEGSNSFDYLNARFNNLKNS